MGGSDDTRLLVEIAHMYYDDQLTQQQIAKQINMSRSLVSKLLNKARTEGVVEITIRDDIVHPHRNLEIRLKEIFGMQEVILADTENSRYPRKRVALEAGKYLARKFPGVHYAAVSAGRMTREIAVNFSSSVPFSNLIFVPMSGGLGEERWEVQANNVCEYFAHNCGAASIQLHAPIVVDSQEARDMLMKQYFIKDVLEKARKADIAIVGIGSSLQYFELKESYLHGLDKDDDKIKERIKGDISYNYFDESGNMVDCRWNRQLMSVNLDELWNIPEVVCAASEEEKAESIYIAMKEGLFTTLVTTADIAKKIIQIHHKKMKK